MTQHARQVEYAALFEQAEGSEVQGRGREDLRAHVPARRGVGLRDISRHV